MKRILGKYQKFQHGNLFLDFRQRVCCGCLTRTWRRAEPTSSPASSYSGIVHIMEGQSPGACELQCGQRASHSGQRAFNSYQRVSQSNQKVVVRCSLAAVRCSLAALKLAGSRVFFPLWSILLLLLTQTRSLGLVQSPQYRTEKNDILSKNRNKNQLLDMAFIQFENNHGVLPRFINIILTWHLFSGTSSKRTKSLNETITVLSTIFRRYFHRLKLFMLFYILGTPLKIFLHSLNPGSSLPTPLSEKICYFKICIICFLGIQSILTYG